MYMLSENIDSNYNIRWYKLIQYKKIVSKDIFKYNV